MIQALLNYQVADAKLNEIEKRLAESPERKMTKFGSLIH